MIARGKKRSEVPTARDMIARGKREASANGAEYDSQGQARSEAERVAPGKQQQTRSSPERA